MNSLPALVVAVWILALLAGSSGGSAGETSQGGADSATAIGRMAGADDPGPTRQKAKPDPEANRAEAEAPLPLGVPVDARDARVRQAIAGSLHPDRSSGNDDGAGRDENQSKGEDRRGNQIGILEQIRRAARGHLEQLAGPDRGHSRRGGGLNILEMLR